MPRLRLAFLSIGHAYTHMAMLLYATVVVGMEGEFGLDYGQRLALATPGFVAYGLGALPAGWLADRWSRRGMLAVFFLALGLATVLTGLARTPLELAAGLTFVGAAAAIYHPAGLAMVADGAAALGRALAINGVAGNLGIAAAPLAAGTLSALFGWRAAFLAPGMLAAATGLVFLAVSRPGAEAGASRAPAGGSGQSSRGLLRLGLVIGCTALAGGVVFDAATVALPKLFDQRLAAGRSDMAALGGLAAAVFAVAACAQLAVGALVDRFALRPLFVAVQALQVPALLAVAWAAGLPLLLAALIAMLAIFGSVPLVDALVARGVAPRWRARAYGAKNTASVAAGALAVPLVAALHGSVGGFTTLFTLLAGCAGLVALSGLLLPRPTKISVPPAGPAGRRPARPPRR